MRFAGSLVVAEHLKVCCNNCVIDVYLKGKICMKKTFLDESNNQESWLIDFWLCLH